MEKRSPLLRLAAFFATLSFTILGLLVFGFLALLFIEDLPPCEKPAKQPVADNEPLFPVTDKNHMGFINREGKTVLRPIADRVSEFHGPTAVAVNYGCANVLSSSYVCPIDMWPWDWRRIVGFGFCLAYQGHLFDRWWLVDRQGHRRGSRRFDFIGDYGEGLYPVNHGGSPNHHGFMSGGKWGYIDQWGKLVIPYRFDGAEAFSEGLAPVRIGGQRFFINHQGETTSVLDPSVCKTWCTVSPFSDGLASVSWYSQNGDQACFVDHTGKVVIPGPLAGAESFHEGLAAVSIGGNRGYIDRTGTVVIPPVYQIAQPFHEGLAMVTANKKAGFIDRTGRVVVPLIYDRATDFSEGLASVRQNGQTAVIDRQGRVVISPRPWRVMSFNNGVAMVEIGDGPRQLAYIDRAGNYVWGPHLFWR